MQVPLLDPTRSYAALAPELLATAQRVLASGRYILGPDVEALEAGCEKYLGAAHALGVSSGTDALLIALTALGVGPGDEVILPTYTFFATAGSVVRLGAKPVFIDADPVTFNLVPEQVAAKLGPKTKAIMPVHLFGQAADMDAIIALGRDKGVPIIEDACQAIGTEYKGRRVGALTEFGCFSFFPSKNLGAFGDAGLLTCNSDSLYATARALRSHGEVTRYDHQRVGGNYRIDALQAALLNVKLLHLESYNTRRASNAQRYSALLLEAGVAAPNDGRAEAPVLVPQERTEGRHTWNQYVVRVPGKRDALKDFLKERGIDTAVYYPVPLHLQKALLGVGHAPGDFPVAEALAQDTLALPIFSELRDDELGYVVEQIVAFFKR